MRNGLPIADEDYREPEPAHTRSTKRAKGSLVSGVALLAASALLMGSGTVLTVDYLDDGNFDTLEAIGVVDGPAGASEMKGSVDTNAPKEPVDQVSLDREKAAQRAEAAKQAQEEADRLARETAGAGGVPALGEVSALDEMGFLPEALAGSGGVAGDPYAVNYEAGADGMPVGGIEGVDLSGISRGGGQGPDDANWSRIAPSSLSIPQAALRMPVVAKAPYLLHGDQWAMALPVSFQAGWLTTSSPVSASAGSTVIAGHVNWADGSWAPMSNLYNARAGMQVLTSDPGGNIQKWRVTEATSVSQDRLSDLFALEDRSGSRQLIMITCQPSTDANGNTVFRDNHVVTAVPA